MIPPLGCNYKGKCEDCIKNLSVKSAFAFSAAALTVFAAAAPGFAVKANDEDIYYYYNENGIPCIDPAGVEGDIEEIPLSSAVLFEIPPFVPA